MYRDIKWLKTQVKLSRWAKEQEDIKLFLCNLYIERWSDDFPYVMDIYSRCLIVIGFRKDLKQYHAIAA